MHRRSLLSACLGWKLLGAQSTNVQPDISYGSAPQQRLDIHLPAGAGTKRPGALVIHGGGWTDGVKGDVVASLVNPLVNEGFVVANVEYRVASAAPAPAAVSDVLEAAYWFRDNARRYDVDTRRIVSLGESAGGHLALMAGMTPKGAKLGPPGKLAAVVNFYGITDVEDQLGGENMRDYAVTWVPEGEARMDLARKVSPVTYARKDVPAILTIHGTSDQVVPYDHGINLTKAVRDAGGDAEMISIPNGAHGFTPDQMKKIWPDVFAFLRKRGIGSAST